MDEPHRLDQITEDDLPVGCSFSMLVAPVGTEEEQKVRGRLREREE